MFIANGANNPIANMIKNKNIPISCQNFYIRRQKKWIIGSLNFNGTIYIDNGAAKALSNGKACCSWHN